MPTDRQILIDIDSSPDDSQLKFQDFVTSETKSSTNNIPSTFKNDDEVENKYTIFSFEYFQRFFDVDTNTVVERIIASMHPKPGVNYLQHQISSKPDLYGPFWICVTLVFTIAISGNIANFLQAAAREEVYHWKYNFHVVSASATTIFVYAWFVPVILWGLLKYNGSNQLTLLELMCVYGYSLSVYVPISILWVIQINVIQWMLVFIGAALSGYVLITSLSSAVGEKNFILLLVFLCLHVLLAVCFMLYFFHVPPMTNIPVVKLENVNKMN